MRKITNLLILLMVILLSLAFLTSSAQRSLIISNQAPQEAKFSELTGNYYKSKINYRNTVFSEDFESGTFPPTGWTKIDFHANPTSNWHSVTESGNTFPQVLYNDANLMDEWLITPSIDLTSYTALQLKFSFFTSYYWLVDPFDGADFMVKVSTDGGTNWTQIWVEEDFGFFENYIWYNVTLPFNAYAGLSDVKIAFHWYGDDGAQTRFDDVILEEPPACPPPTGLYAENITSTTAILGWTPGGSETLWNVEVGLPGFTPGTLTAVTSVYGSNENPWTAKELNPGTTYEYYVQADCGAKEESSWAGPYTFITLCEFECPIGSIAETEACGDTINNGCNLVITPLFESVNPGDIICGTVWAEGGTRDTDWFELILAEPSQVILHAFAQTELTFGLLAGIDPTNPECDSVSGIDPFDLTEICTPVTLDLGILVAGTHWFFAGLPVFDGYPCDINYWIEFEVIEVECAPPTNLTAINITTTSADLGWTPGGTEILWNVEVGAPGFTPGTGTEILGATGTSSNPWTASPLTSATEYEFYVQADCGDFSRTLSDWAGPFPFNTLVCDPVDQCVYEFVLYDDFGDGWNGATMEVIQNGIVVHVLGLGFTSGAEATEFVPLCDGIGFDVFWNTGGSYPGEVGLKIIDPYGMVLYDVALIGSANVGTTIFSGIADCTPPECPPPTDLYATNITTTSADLGWTPGGTEAMWHVEVGVPGFAPGTGTALLSDYFTPDNPWLASPLNPGMDYEFYVKAYCNGFENPKIDRFWMAMPGFGVLDPLLSGGTMDDPGETGEWYFYENAPLQPWWNIWFYNGEFVPENMKKVRMGFWVQSLDGINPGEIQFVVNWSTPEWSLLPDPPTPFPMPMDEFYIERSPINPPMIVDPVGPQWIEFYYIIEDYNPEWISVDIWGANIQILEEYLIPPPPESALAEFWTPGPGGIIVHECLPKDHSSSDWSGPLPFSTLCLPVDVPLCENFDGVTAPVIPDCWTVTNNNADAYSWETYATNPNSAPNAMAIRWNSTLAMDDWFFSPGLNLEGGVTYQVDFYYRAGGATFPEAMEVLWGTYPDAAGMTGGLIWDNNSIINETYELGTGTFTPPTTGVYYVGWHGYSAADQFILYVDDICIAEEEPEVPENRTVDGVTISDLDDECFDATNTITVTNTVVESGGIANFIAGVNIIFGEGFIVENGGYMWARIDNVYCNPPALLSAIEEAPEVMLPEITASESFFKVFPNPTTSTFKLELLGADEAAIINVEIYGMMGERVFQDVLFGGLQYEFDLSNMPKGIYFIRVLMGDEMGIEKVIKQ